MTSLWKRSGSATSAPIVIAGLSEACGSWKTICSRRRSGRSSASLRPVELLALEPDRARRSASTSPSSVRPSVVLPDPDSPTSPSTSPWRRSSETPSTALTEPRLAAAQAVEERSPHRVGGVEVADLEQRVSPLAAARPARRDRSCLLRHERTPRARAARGRPRGSRSSGPCSQHETRWPAGGAGPRPGRSSAQTRIAFGQRGWKRHAGGGSTRSAGAPGM